MKDHENSVLNPHKNMAQIGFLRVTAVIAAERKETPTRQFSIRPFRVRKLCW